MTLKAQRMRVELGQVANLGPGREKGGRTGRPNSRVTGLRWLAVPASRLHHCHPGRSRRNVGAGHPPLTEKTPGNGRTGLVRGKVGRTGLSQGRGGRTREAAAQAQATAKVTKGLRLL